MEGEVFIDGVEHFVEVVFPVVDALGAGGNVDVNKVLGEVVMAIGLGEGGGGVLGEGFGEDFLLNRPGPAMWGYSVALMGI